MMKKKLLKALYIVVSFFLVFFIIISAVFTVQRYLLPGDAHSIFGIRIFISDITLKGTQINKDDLVFTVDYGGLSSVKSGEIIAYKSGIDTNGKPRIFFHTVSQSDIDSQSGDTPALKKDNYYGVCVLSLPFLGKVFRKIQSPAVMLLFTITPIIIFMTVDTMLKHRDKLKIFFCGK